GRGTRFPRGADQGASQRALDLGAQRRTRVAGQQALHLAAQGDVLRAGGVQKGRALLGRQLHRPVEQSLDAVAARLRHRRASSSQAEKGTNRRIIFFVTLSRSHNKRAAGVEEYRSSASACPVETTRVR